MKIIKSGNFPKEAKGVCPICGCEFIAEKDDINFMVNTYCSPPMITRAFTCCPECDYETSLDITQFENIGG